jgi:serine protease Do
MKKWIWAAAAALLAWDVVLSLQISNLKNEEASQAAEPSAAASSESGAEIVTNTLNGYVTDITQAAEQVQSRMVTIEADGEDVGSGLIYESQEDKTWILTSASFCSDEEALAVVFDNGVSVEAELVGSDEATDLALLSCTPGFNCEAVSRGDAGLVKEGEYVIALGARDFVTQSAAISFGVVSLPAQVPVENSGSSPWITEYFPTDMRLQEGLAGGGLFNLSGQLIGMISPAADSSYCRAVTLHEIENVVPQLMENGTVSRGYLGVTGRDVSELENYEKSSLNISLDILSGVVVMGVEENSPAAFAGISQGDVILMVDDTAVDSMTDLRAYLYRCTPGQVVTLEVQRDTAQMSVTVTLA